MSDAKLCLTMPQLRVLDTAIGFLACGEWSETINAREHTSLMIAQDKIRAAIAKAGTP